MIRPLSARSELAAGVRAVLPILTGVAPFGMIYGVLAVGAGIPPLAAQAMSAIVFAGASQFLAVQLVASGAPWWVIVFSMAVINLRHVLYSASIAPHFHHLPRRWKAALSYLLTDEAYALAITRYTTPGGDGPNRHLYYLGAGWLLWGVWQLSSAAGIFLGARIPAQWSLDFTLALTFIAILVPALAARPTLAAALSAGAVAVLAHGLPYQFGLALAALAGITVGLASEGLWKKSG